MSSQSGGQGTVDTGHPLADASVPRVANTARVTPSSMGEGSPHGGGYPAQGQVEGQWSGVKTSGYGEQQRIVVSDLGVARGGRENHTSDSHVGVHASQSKGAVPWGEPLYGGAAPDTPVLESLPSHRGVRHSSPLALIPGTGVQ